MAVASSTFLPQNHQLAGSLTFNKPGFLKGLALLPHWLIDEDVHDGKLLNLFPDYEVTATNFNTAAWLVYPSRAYIPLKARIFTDEIKKRMLI